MQNVKIEELFDLSRIVHLSYEDVMDDIKSGCIRHKNLANTYSERYMKLNKMVLVRDFLLTSISITQQEDNRWLLSVKHTALIKAQ